VVLTSKDKVEIIDQFKIHEKDTGSSNVLPIILRCTPRIIIQGGDCSRWLVKEGAC